MLHLFTPIRTSLLALALCVSQVGCYSDESLLKRIRNHAIRTRVDEVELGQFRVTLPRNDRTGEMTEIDIRIFGESFRYRVNEIEEELEAKAPLIEDLAMRTLRETTRQELAEPDLESLRGRLLNSMNQLLTDAPLASVGFYDVRFIRH
ncbi:hypothetical protein Pla108_24810 [Botrimarina colliarenosi]|uniref:Flagellar protein FliL n=1 Tax=Botrimarina colliarenosi TaxID=2528001 RepID=A0A5C6ABG4_9BACT|nr:flagellar basal body-associated FliL family protein [Botrimarina colliarenosi]TWT96707.1 hypothetical protein Pla108_24810 [Botrimarina colliarenosi]